MRKQSFRSGILAFWNSRSGDKAEIALAAKRADYFEAGTRVVWDVDPVNNVIFAYHADSPETPQVFRPGDLAHAEPAVPGWTVAVDRILA